MVGKPRRNPVTDQQIIASYRQTFSVYKTAEALGIGTTTAHRVLMKHNEPRPGLQRYREKITKYRGQEQAIRKLYENGATYAELREQFGDGSDSDYALKQALKRAGAELRENPAPLVQPGELQKIKEMNAQGMGQTRISLALGRSQSFVGRLMRKHGMTPVEMIGAKHPGWKGGRWIDSNGYVRVMLDEKTDRQLFSMKQSDGYVLEHRLIMARKFGRPLRRNETVHHINGDREDNRPENLEIRQGKHGKNTVLRCGCCGSYNIIHEQLSETGD